MISRRPRKEGFGANGTIKASFDSTVSVREKPLMPQSTYCGYKRFEMSLKGCEGHQADYS
jgi:hypothetical protein